MCYIRRWIGITIYNVMLDLQPHNIQHCIHVIHTYMKVNLFFLLLRDATYSFSPYFIILLCSYGLISLLSTNATTTLTESLDGEQVAVVGVIEEKRTVEASHVLLSLKCKCGQQNHFDN